MRRDCDAALAEAVVRGLLAGAAAPLWQRLAYRRAQRLSSDDHTAKIWITSTGECLQTLSGHTGFVDSAVFSTEGSLVLTTSDDGTARIWDTLTGECSQILSGAAPVLCAVFSAG